jgi:hypothetical protein
VKEPKDKGIRSGVIEVTGKERSRKPDGTTSQKPEEKAKAKAEGRRQK